MFKNNIINSLQLKRNKEKHNETSNVVSVFGGMVCKGYEYWLSDAIIQ